MEVSSKISVFPPYFFSIINFESFSEIDFKLFFKCSICYSNNSYLYMHKIKAILIVTRFKKRLKLLKSDIIFRLKICH